MTRRIKILNVALLALAAGVIGGCSSNPFQERGAVNVRFVKRLDAPTTYLEKRVMVGDRILFGAYPPKTGEPLRSGGGGYHGYGPRPTAIHVAWEDSATGLAHSRVIPFGDLYKERLTRKTIYVLPFGKDVSVFVKKMVPLSPVRCQSSRSSKEVTSALEWMSKVYACSYDIEQIYPTRLTVPLYVED